MDRGKRSKHSGWRLAVNCGILLLGCVVSRARALDNEADLQADVFYLYDETQDLGLPDAARGEYGLNLRPRLYTSLSEEWHSFVSLQLFYATDTVDLSTDEFDQARASDRFAELRQLWLEWGGLTDYPGEALRVGRERLRMDDGLVLDSDIVTARWAWDTTLLKGGIGVAEELDTFRTDDSELSEAEDNLKRTYAMLRWQYRYNAFVSAHVIDTDGSDNTVNAPQLTWSGVSFDNGYFDFRTRLPWQYYFTVYGVNGHETKDGAQVDVNGWAVDGGMRWRSSGDSGFNVGTQLSFTDDKPDGYRQTGLQSNRAYYLGARTRLHRLNEALRADFRNIGIATAYVGLLPERSPLEVGLAGHSMFLRDENGPFSARGYSGHTNGKDKDVGRALDLVISWYWDKNDNVMADDVRMDSYLRLILSGFFPGKAFDAGGDDREVNRASVEWAVTF
jgi:alginate production protein